MTIMGRPGQNTAKRLSLSRSLAPAAAQALHYSSVACAVLAALPLCGIVDGVVPLGEPNAEGVALAPVLSAWFSGQMLVGAAICLKLSHLLGGAHSS